MKTRSFFLRAVLLLALQLFATHNGHAGSARWKTTTIDNNWNRAGNWTPRTVPNGPSDTATFLASNTIGISLSSNVEVSSTTFPAGASAFTIAIGPTLTLTISGAGITNSGGTTQTFATNADISGTAGTIQFTNSASAGSITAFTNDGGTGNDLALTVQ